jgi:type IV pilus assembly protein PilM
MASRTIGLDVGTHAVRVAEVAFGRGAPTLTRFGQVALPFGAVVAGEVVDPPAVAAALKRLWRETGLKGRNVVTGVANGRVVARIAEVPDMPDEELRSSLKFQVQDLIPIPVEEAVLDYQVVERIERDGQPMQRILLVAAHRDMVRGLLAALDGAGLVAERIDLVPFALIRAVHTNAFADLGPDATDGAETDEAIVGIGAGVTNVVVHERGLPRFVRTLATGGNAVVESIASELGVDIDTAEDLKRRGDALSHDPALSRAASVTSASLGPLLEEVRGSLDFYTAQADGARLRRIVLTGGGSRLPDLALRLEGLLGVPVAAATPLQGIELGSTGFPPEVIAANADLLTVPLGLALGGDSVDGAGRRISLLPGEIAVERAARRQVVMAGGAVAAVAAGLFGLFLVRQGTVSDAQEAAAREEARTETLTAKVASLSEVEQLEADLAGRRAVVEATLAGDVAWPRLLQEVSTVLPNDVWLTSFTGTRGLDPTQPSTVTFAATGFDQTSAARWLLRVGELPSFEGLWLPSSTKVEGGTGRELVQFSSNANLTPAAGSERAADYADDAEAGE